MDRGYGNRNCKAQQCKQGQWKLQLQHKSELNSLVIIINEYKEVFIFHRIELNPISCNSEGIPSD